jgi:hypothetical protein
MLEDIDQAIVGLLALRHLIDEKALPPDRFARARGTCTGSRVSLWSWLVAALRPAAARGDRPGRFRQPTGGGHPGPTLDSPARPSGARARTCASARGGVPAVIPARY